MSDTTTEAAKIGQAFRYCADIVRLQDKDRFLSSLFAPAEQRLFLCALYAFDIETAHVRDLVHEPMAGNIRLQWWHEAMAGLRPDEAAAHPVLTALMYAVDASGGDRSPLARAIEARQSELYGEPAVGAASAIFQMASRFLAPKGDHLADDIIDDAGRAATFVRDPVDPEQAAVAYEAFRARVKSLPVPVRPAFLHLALVPLRLRQPDASQWRRQLALIRAAWLGYPSI